jgi:Septum formation initiator.
VVIIGFLDENSMVRRVGNMREMNHLQNEIERYKADYDKNTRKLNDLTANPVEMEKVAREKYLMKKPNEDIYVFEEDSDQIQDQEQN